MLREEDNSEKNEQEDPLSKDVGSFNPHPTTEVTDFDDATNKAEEDIEKQESVQETPELT